MITTVEGKHTSTHIEYIKSSYFDFISFANPPHPFGGGGCEQMAWSSWLPRFKKTLSGHARWKLNKSMRTSVEQDPRSTKSPLKMYLFVGEGVPASSRIWSRSRSCPCKSPIMWTWPSLEQLKWVTFGDTFFFATKSIMNRTSKTFCHCNATRNKQKKQNCFGHCHENIRTK